MKRLFLFVCLFSFAGPSITSAGRIADLQSQLQAVQAENEALKKEIAELKSQLAAATAAAATPAPAAPVAVAAPANVVAVSTSAPPSTAPASADPPSGAKFQRTGPWNVKVVSLIDPDLQTIKSQLDSEQRRLPRLESNAEELRDHRDEMASAKVRRYDTALKRFVFDPKYADADVAKARLAASQADNELKDAKQKVAKLQRDYDTAQNSATVIATLDDGTTVEVTGEGTVAKVLVQQMTVGQRYKVEGTSLVKNGQMSIKATRALPATS